MMRTVQKEQCSNWRVSEGMRWAVAPLFLIIAFYWYFQSHPIYATTSYACSRCRSVQLVTTWFGLKSRRVEEGDYARWFAQSYPQHQHRWCWCGSEKSYYSCGIGRGCGRQHFLWLIQPDDQRQFVAVATPKELQQFYACMDSSDREEQQKGAVMVWDKLR